MLNIELLFHSKYGLKVHLLNVFAKIKLLHKLTQRGNQQFRNKDFVEQIIFR
jgi:hypothetical protein